MHVEMLRPCRWCGRLGNWIYQSGAGNFYECSPEQGGCKNLDESA